VLYREPMWLKCAPILITPRGGEVSVLYREPMWLKCKADGATAHAHIGFSALP